MIIRLVGLLLIGTGLGGWLRSYTQAGREAARRATCVSNIKCLALSLVMYAQDHEGRLPVLARGQRDTWAIAAERYVHSADVLWCPGDGRFRQYARARRPGAEAESDGRDLIRLRRQRIGVASSYVMNPQLSGVRIEDMKDPVNTVMLEESPGFHKGYRVVAYAAGYAKALKLKGE